MADESKLPPAIILIGPPGSGKSACASALARRLGWVSLDADQLIEEQSGMTVPEIFKNLGEAHFRQLETELLERLISKSKSAGGSGPYQPFVLATGGGMPVTAGNFERLVALGDVVLLEATLDSLASRVAEEGGRPLLADSQEAGPDTAFERVREKLAGLMSERALAYSKARYKVHTTARPPEEVAEAILELLNIATWKGRAV